MYEYDNVIRDLAAVKLTYDDDDEVIHIQTLDKFIEMVTHDDPTSLRLVSLMEYSYKGVEVVDYKSISHARILYKDDNGEMWSQSLVNLVLYGLLTDPNTDQNMSVWGFVQ